MKVIRNESLDTDQLLQLRRNLPLTGWQKQIYVLITEKLNTSVLDRLMTYVNRITPDDANEEDKKIVIIRAMSDYLDSVL